MHKCCVVIHFSAFFALIMPIGNFNCYILNVKIPRKLLLPMGQWLFTTLKSHDTWWSNYEEKKHN